MQRILIIDDEPQIRRFLNIGLGSQQYDMIEADCGKAGLQQVALESPSLVILDLGLPDMEGLEVLKLIREFYDKPVIILSIRSQEREIVELLNAGANDYVVKPFGIKELIARVRVLLRDSVSNEEGLPTYDDGRLSLDVLQHRVSVNGNSVQLSRKEFKLLQILVENHDRVITHQQLIRHLWDASHLDDQHYLRILVRKLRNKLNDNVDAPQFIETVSGIGYRFITSQKFKNRH